jgi:cytochrome P450
MPGIMLSAARQACEQLVRHELRGVWLRTRWPDPGRFEPGRPRPAWGHLPFAAGRRARPARLMARTALSAFRVQVPTQVSGNPAPRPHGPLWLEHR